MRSARALSPLLPVALCALSLTAPGAQAELPAAGWEATSTAIPTDLAPGGKGTIEVQPLNVGAANSAGEVRIKDTLPPGVTASDAGELEREQVKNGESPKLGHSLWDCTIAPAGQANSVVSCHNDPVGLASITGGAGISTGPLKPGDPSNGIARQPAIGIAVDISPSAPQGTQANVLEVSGGGAAAAITLSEPLQISSARSPFGFSRWRGWFSNADGTLDTQAGSVPYSASFSLAFNKFLKETTEEFDAVGGDARNFVVQLPPGFLASPPAVAQCTRQQLDELKCPRTSQIGVVRAQTSARFTLTLELFNMVPPPGVAAQFAFPYEQINVFLNAGVRTGSDYGATTRVNNAPERKITSAMVTIWGVPGDPSHNVWRRATEGGCTQGELESPGSVCNLGDHPELKPFLSLPSACGEPQAFSISANTWLDPLITDEASFLSTGPGGGPAGFAQCASLPFAPSIQSKPTSAQADSPAGLSFTLHMPQPQSASAVEEAGKTVRAETDLAEADLKDSIVTLPQGVSVNPSSANGLQACSAAQIGLRSAPGAAKAEYSEDPAQCPGASQIGEVEVHSQLVDHPLHGGVYVATPFENPFDSLIAIYIAINDPQTGVVVKLAGQVTPDPQTGQLLSSFPETPQLPFEEFKLHFFEGAGAALRTPPTCGIYQTSSLLTPWSSPEGAPASPSDSFEVTQSAGGGTCPSTLSAEPDQPTLQAGTVSSAAGAFTPLVLRLAREDGSQELKSLSLTLPPGLLGKIAGVGRCPESAIAQAEGRNNQGQGALELADPSCPASSELGTVTVGAGAGPHPYYASGRAYLAGPYAGAPFDVAVITPAIAGPFDLGTVVVRTPLYLDPATAQVTARSNAFPSILDGVPLDIRSIALNMNRPGFIFNPSNCNPLSVTGQTTSVIGHAVALNAPFYTSACKSLPFKPKLSASVLGKASKANGTTFKVDITSAGIGQAGIAKVNLALPKALPSRLTTLQKACLAAVFEANPAACDPASAIGTATVRTPLLDSPLTGPAYLVSHGNAAFPDVEFVLQGEGIELLLDGKTDIKKGITYSHFEAVPDAPFSSFETTLPAGPHSILTASVPAKENYSLCKAPLAMATELLAQNGAKIAQSTKVTPTGCRKSRPLTRAQKLAAALKSCRKKSRHNAKRRKGCERKARLKFGSKKGGRRGGR